MGFAQRHAITDTCILVRDLEASIAFYRDRLGFVLLHRAPGFADFTGAGHTLALWERGHISRHAGIPVDPDATSSVAIAVRLEDTAQLDAAYAELSEKGVAFVRPPPITPGTRAASISPARTGKSGSSTRGFPAARRANFKPMQGARNPIQRPGRLLWPM